MINWDITFHRADASAPSFATRKSNGSSKFMLNFKLNFS
jgi:hypothetical protein